MLSALANANPMDLWQPDILGVSLIIQFLYLMATIGPWKTRFAGYRPVARKTIVTFLIGMWVMYFSFAGPLDYLSDNYLFSAHMVQHQLEIMLMTPLIIFGIPDWMFQPLLRFSPSRKVITVWAHPTIAGAVFNIVYTGFHLPDIYNYALINESFHLFEHTVFFVIAFFMWLPIISRFTGLEPLSSGKRLLYLLYNYNLMMPIVVLLIVANHPWYSYYVTAPRIIPGVGPLFDQQLGGIIMAVGSVIPFLAVGTKAFMAQNELVWYS